MPKPCGPGCDGRDCTTRAKLAALATGVTLLKRDHENEEETPMGKPLTYTEALKKRQAGELDKFADLMIREAVKSPPAPKAPPLTREMLFGVMKRRAVEMFRDRTPEQALTEYVSTPEGARCYELYETLPAEARTQPAEPTGVAKLFHPGSAKARVWNEIDARARKLMEERYAQAHRAGRAALFTREQAIAEVVLADPSLYERFEAASDEPVER